MFEPDGRNTVQYLGHMVTRVLGILMSAVGVLILFPLFMYLWYSNTIGAQRMGVELWNNAPILAVCLDYNHPGLSVSGICGEHVTYPAGIEVLRRNANRDYIGARYFWYYLPVVPGVITDLRSPCETQGPVPKPKVLPGIEGPQDVSDPWDVRGLWNLAPGHNWDTASPELYLQSKATQNYEAYVQATNIVALIRAYGAGKHFGKDLSDILPGTSGNPYVEPAEAARRTVEAVLWREYVQVYNNLFAGKLPIVVLHLQTLDKEEVNYKNSLSESFCGLFTRVGLGPFVTGMSAGPGFTRYLGRPEWYYGDFFLWGSPQPSPSAREAQEALLDLQRLSYWIPRLEAEGLGAPEDIAAIKRILDYRRAIQRSNIRACRLDAHHRYNWTANSFNPLRTDLDSYNPRNR